MPLSGVARVVSLLYKREEGKRGMEELVHAEGIGKPLLALLSKRLSTGRVENWASRLDHHFSGLET